MGREYEREKLGAAVHALAASAQPIQKRLEYAWTAMHTLIHHGLSDPERQAAFSSINDRLTADKSNPEAGHMPTTCAGLTDDEASQIATDIVELEAMLSLDRIFELEERLRAQK